MATKSDVEAFDTTIGGKYEPLGEHLSPETERYVQGQEVAELNAPMRFSMDDLASLDSIDDVMALADAHNIPVLESTNVFAGGFVNVENKEVLIGVPLIIIHWEFFYSSKFNCDGVAVWAVTERPIAYPGGTGKKVIFTDLSTGICAELKTRTKVAGIDFIRFPNGISSNTYTKELPDGSTTEATTYRLS